MLKGVLEKRKERGARVSDGSCGQRKKLSILVPPIPGVGLQIQNRRARNRGATTWFARLRGDNSRWTPHVTGFHQPSEPLDDGHRLGAQSTPEPESRALFVFCRPKKNSGWYRRPGETAAGRPRPVARRATFAVHRRYVCTSVRSSHLASERRTSVVVKGMRCASPGALNTNRAAKFS